MANCVPCDDRNHQAGDDEAHGDAPIIKVLTLLTAITTPTVLIGTWYGMNFQDMPELHLPYAYPVASAVTILCTVLLVVWLRKRHWL